MTISLRELTDGDRPVLFERWSRRRLTALRRLGIFKTLTIVSFFLLPLSVVGAGEVSFAETLLFTLPPSAEIEQMVLEDQDEYDDAGRRFSFLSRDGKTLSLVYQLDGAWIVQDGDRLDRRMKDVNGLYRAPNGRIAYSGRADMAWHVAIGESTHGPYPKVNAPIFPTRGNRWAFAAFKSGAWKVVTDTEEFGPYDSVSDLVFSGDGKRLAFCANQKKKDGDFTVVIDGKAGSKHQRVASPVFSANNKVVAFVATKDDESWIVSGGKSYPKCAKIEQFAFAGRQIVYQASVPEGFVVHRGKKATPTLSWVSDFVSPPKAKGAYYAGLQGNDLHIFKGVKSYANFPSVKNPIHFEPSPDGKRFAYIADAPFGLDGVSVIDKKAPGPPLKSVYPKIWWAPKNKGYVYIARHSDGRIRVMERGKQTSALGAFDDIYPEIHFDSSGKRIAFCARSGREIWWRVRNFD